MPSEQDIMSLEIKTEKLRPDSGALDIVIPPKLPVRRFLEWQREFCLRIFIEGTGRMITANYTSGSLETLEFLLPKTPGEWRNDILPCAIDRGFGASPANLWLLHLPLGSYFGEVLVRNLGGKWRHPSRILGILALLLSRPGLVYSHWYVVVGKQKVPVFELARRRGTMGPEESLFRVYQLIAKGSFKNLSMGPQCTSKKP